MLHSTPLLIVVLFICLSVNAAEFDQLKPNHPRLLITDGDVQRALAQIQNNGDFKQVHARLVQQAEDILQQPPVVYELRGPRLLHVSREALRRISILAGLNRIHAEPKYVQRALVEMRTVCSFADWHPDHFLDTAEMCAAVAIGYDWLFDHLSPQDRELFRKAIISHAIKPALDAWEKKVWWTKTDINWAQVCSGGLLLGALAIAEDEPRLAETILKLTRPSIEGAMKVYAPDGGYAEGPGYWNYGTHYNVLYLAALQTALGTDFGLADVPGFADAGLFRIHTIGPTGKRFNFADCGEASDSAPCMFWLSRRFDRPIYAAHEREQMSLRPDVFHLLWLDERPADLSTLPTGALFKNVNVACLRSGWTKDATFLGIKGGSNQASHGHLDLGSFVLDALGERWATDLGPDDYNLPGYFGKQRWDYYRLRTEGHNTLNISGQNQVLTAAASVMEYESNDLSERVKIDLSAAYTPHFSLVFRSIVFARDGELVIGDSFRGSGKNIRWTMHTPAAIDIASDHQSASLRLNGKTMEVTVCDDDSRLRVEAVEIPAPQRTLKGISRLVIEKDIDSQGMISIRFKPRR